MARLTAGPLLINCYTLSTFSCLYFSTFILRGGVFLHCCICTASNTGSWSKLFTCALYIFTVFFPPKKIIFVNHKHYHPGKNGTSLFFCHHLLLLFGRAASSKVTIYVSHFLPTFTSPFQESE